MMETNPVTVQVTASVPEVNDIMLKNKINKVPVVDKNGALLGLITKNDLVKSTPSEATTLDMFELSYLLSKLTVEKVMVKNVKTVGEYETVEEAARLMADYGIGSLAVVKNELLVGFITENDVFKAFIDMFGTRHAGVRATFIMNDKPGALNVFTQALAELNGNIVSLVTADVEEKESRKVTLRVTGVSLEQVKALIEKCAGILEDIRNV
mgnify:FL=1